MADTTNTGVNATPSMLIEKLVTMVGDAFGKNPTDRQRILLNAIELVGDSVSAAIEATYVDKAPELNEIYNSLLEVETGLEEMEKGVGRLKTAIKSKTPETANKDTADTKSEDKDTAPESTPAATKSTTTPFG